MSEAIFTAKYMYKKIRDNIIMSTLAHLATAPLSLSFLLIKKINRAT